MKYTCSKKMKKLQKREPSLYVAVVLFAAALLLFALTPAIAGALGGGAGAAGISGGQAAGPVGTGAAASEDLTGAAASVVFYLPRVVLAAGFMALFFFIRRVAERRARLEGLDAERLELADRELEQAEAFAEGAKVYVTPHFLISGDYQFDIVPWADIERTYYAGDLLAVSTTGQKAHVVASHADRKPWVKDLEREIERRMEAAAVKAASKPDRAKGRKAAEKPGQSGTRAKEKRTNYKTVPKPTTSQALAGGLLLALPGIAIWTLFCGFAIWGPLLGAMAMFYLISIGYVFGIKGLFMRHKDLGQWSPEEGVRPVLGMSLAIILVCCVVYHVVLLVVGYPDFHYTYGYALWHLAGLLKQHQLFGLFLNRLLLALLMLLILGFRYGAAKGGRGDGRANGKKKTAR